MKIQSPVHDRSSGPFVASQLRDGDRYELSNGHAIYAMPASPRHAGRTLDAGKVVSTDPAVKWAGVDAGFSPEPKVLRAPDVAVGDVEEAPGWGAGVPPFAIEYADTGQDEAELQRKITELLALGTKHIWVVRLEGLPRVEVHEPGQSLRTVTLDEELHAPGILQNPVPVRALFEPEAANAATFRNLLQRYGYGSLDEVRAEGKDEGEAIGLGKALLTLLHKRGLEISATEREKVFTCRDLEQLNCWLDRAIEAEMAAEVFEAG